MQPPALAPAPPQAAQQQQAQFSVQQPNAQVLSQLHSRPEIPGLMTGWDGQQDTSTPEQMAATALRAQLLQNIHSPKPGTEAPGVPVSHDDNMNIDPAISGVGNLTGQQVQGVVNLPPQGPQMDAQMASASPADMSSSPGDTAAPEQPKRGGKRELSTSKRAAQNRAAQRAFRQRKETYIKKLEEQVRDMAALEESYKQIQNENYQLRDYIISLQSRLIESQGEDAVPPAPMLIAHQNPLVQPQPQPPSMLGAPVIAPAPPPQPTAPTANMGVPHPQAGQMAKGMMVHHPPPPLRLPPAESRGVEGVKRSLEKDSTAFNGLVAKKLKGAEMNIETNASEQSKPAEINGNSS